MNGMRIGELAARGGVSVETLRYYERRGLIDAPARTPSGYREYSIDDLDRLRFIANAKRFGFTLSEIVDVVAAAADRSLAAVQESAAAKLAEVIEEQRQLAAVRGRLERLVTLCATGDTDGCVGLDVG